MIVIVTGAFISIPLFMQCKSALVPKNYTSLFGKHKIVYNESNLFFLSFHSNQGSIATKTKGVTDFKRKREDNKCTRFKEAEDEN